MMMRISSCKILLFVLGFSVLSGCTLYTKPEVPEVKKPDHFKTKIKITNAKLKDDWWKNFNDPKLTQLVEQGLKNNYSYQAAIKNIQVACTYVTQAQSALYPQISLNFNTSRNKSAANVLNQFNGANTLNPNSSSFTHIFNLQQLIGTVSYEADVWNQLGNAVKQAQANQTISETDAKTIKLTLITSIVDTYFQIVTFNENISNLKAQYHAVNQIVQLYQTQLKGGLIDASILDTAKNQSETIKSNINNLQKQKQVLENSLAYLVGEYPESFKYSTSNNIMSLRAENLVPAGIPSLMMANRPDIQGAYYQIISYGYLEKQNIANFLPSIMLTGTYGYSSTALSNLLAYNHTYWNYGIYTAQYLYDAQYRMSLYKRSQYQFESAFLTYRDTVLNAFQEVDSALDSYKEDNEALASFHRQTINSKDLLAVADAQYQSGLSDYTTYLNNKLTYLQSSYNLANQKLLVIEDVVQVYKTLGLGLG